MPANARGKAYVYKFKETHTGMRTGDESGLAKYKETWTGYAIIEPNDNNTARMWRIYLWKSDGLTEVDMQDMMTCGFLQIPVGKNTVWIITYEDETQNFILSGIAKPAKVANPNPFIAASIRAKCYWLMRKISMLVFVQAKFH